MRWVCGRRLLAGAMAFGMLFHGGGVVAQPMVGDEQPAPAVEAAAPKDVAQRLLGPPVLSDWWLTLGESAPAAAAGSAGGMSKGLKIGALVTGGVVVTGATVVILASSEDKNSNNDTDDQPGNAVPPDDVQAPLSWHQQQSQQQPDEWLAAEIRARDDYRFINEWWTDKYGGEMPRINPYDLMGLSYAHAAGYRGEEIIIGLLDDTFQLDHPMLQGQVAGDSGTLPGVNSNTYHGTHVAGLAAGHSATMIGVAPEAKLFLASFKNSTLNGWATKFQDARQAGARVHSNSWGWDADGLLDTRLAVELLADPVAALANWQETEDFNHWYLGFTDYAADQEFKLSAYQDNPGLVLEAYFNIAYNSPSPAASWNNLAAAMHDFQTQGNGVILWALENHRLEAPDGTFYADAPAALPELYPDLQGAWLTVANVNVFSHSDGQDYAVLYSSGCHQTASYCLSHNGGFVNSAVPFNDYDQLTGTSMATPQVAGAVAILAQAFPGHSGEQLVNRLLATASNFDDWQAVEERDGSWYGTLTLPDNSSREVEFMVLPVEANQESPLDPGEIGVVDFGNGITHAYSELLGHGFVNLRAALQPVGEVAVPVGQQLDTVRREDLQASRVLLGPAFGDSLTAGLAGRTVAVLDGLDGAFQVPLGHFVQAADPGSDLGGLLAGFGPPPLGPEIKLGRGGRLAAAFRSAENGPPAGLTAAKERQSKVAELSWRQELGRDSLLRFDYNRNPGLAFGLPAAGTVQPEWMVSRQAFVNPLLSLVERGESLGADVALNRWATLRLGAFQGSQSQQWQQNELAPQEDHRRARLRGAATELALGLGPAAAPAAGLALQAALVQEENTLLGSHSGGAFELAQGTSSYTVGLSGELALGEWSGGGDLRLAANVFAAYAQPQAAADSLFTEVSTVAGRAWSVGLLAQRLLTPADRWGLVLHQPLRVVDGQAELRLPVGHDGTELRHDTVRVDLRPTGRETRLEMFYGRPLMAGADLRGSLMLRRQPGHVHQAPSEGVALLRTTVTF
ncbi:peptidase S8 and S53 subtilisin kexin sedolisin [Desulfurivibrio alkaliphilus AHT 2]|uniref:Peptidase S8 and S53 subtilisin kexin sedolisin n=2 Tax=Desulfurivibrio alkaliphilus TaxID=427923 RepID=D6Z5W4_DESAT|nr:peptidase S8 and S53 subtilisin kexin sedolisin [Desulfurivibrio alkaliphilus AHT 2]